MKTTTMIAVALLSGAPVFAEDQEVRVHYFSIAHDRCPLWAVA
jgi:hypothetical protein